MGVGVGVFRMLATLPLAVRERAQQKKRFDFKSNRVRARTEMYILCGAARDVRVAEI